MEAHYDKLLVLEEEPLSEIHVSNLKELFPPAQRDNLLQSFLDDIAKRAEDENIPLPRAFAEVALDWLSEDLDGLEIAPNSTDGPGDRGIDAYRISPEAVVIYQFKGRSTLDREEILKSGSVDLLTDISRVISILTSTTPVVSANEQTKKFLSKLRSYLRVFDEAEKLTGTGDAKEPNAIPVITLKFVVLANGLTAQALEEFETLRKSSDVFRVLGVDVLFDIELITIETFLSLKWKRSNAQWRDVTGNKNQSMQLHVEGQKIRDKSSMIFYTRAIDLILAFNNFGYQLFEPNVRCQITNSRVNREIAKQVATEKGIEQFKDLNNGVTLVYQSFSEKDRSVILTKPGVVNGLQTVTTLTEAYNTMSEGLRKFFESTCHILVRLYSKSSVNVPALVIATRVLSLDRYEPFSANLLAIIVKLVRYERRLPRPGVPRIT